MTLRNSHKMTLRHSILISRKDKGGENAAWTAVILVAVMADMTQVIVAGSRKASIDAAALAGLDQVALFQAAGCVART